MFSVVCNWTVEIKGGRIVSVLEEEHWQKSVKSLQVIDYGNAVIMPGLVDV